MMSLENATAKAREFTTSIGDVRAMVAAGTDGGEPSTVRLNMTRQQAGEWSLRFLSGRPDDEIVQNKRMPLKEGETDAQWMPIPMDFQMIINVLRDFG